MKTILVPLLDDDSDEAELLANAAIKTAHLIARRFGSHIEGLFVRGTPLHGVASLDVSPQHFDAHRDYWNRNTDKYRNIFSAFMVRNDIPLQNLANNAAGPSAEWRETEGNRPQIVGSYGRLFDLIVIPRTKSDTVESSIPTCEAALFESGRPVVLAPPSVPTDLGRNVVISWNGGTETARTIGLGMPLLRCAETITVLSVQGAAGGMVSGPDGEQVAAHLVRNGLKAAAVTVDSRGRTSGATVLDEAAARGADLIVKGAYTHHRLRQIIFGGTTRHVLAEAKIAVLVAH